MLKAKPLHDFLRSLPKPSFVAEDLYLLADASAQVSEVAVRFSSTTVADQSSIFLGAI